MLAGWVLTLRMRLMAAAAAAAEEADDEVAEAADELLRLAVSLLASSRSMWRGRLEGSRKTTARITPWTCSSGHEPVRMRCGRPRPFGRSSARSDEPSTPSKVASISSWRTNGHWIKPKQQQKIHNNRISISLISEKDGVELSTIFHIFLFFLGGCFGIWSIDGARSRLKALISIFEHESGSIWSIFGSNLNLGIELTDHALRFLQWR